MGPPGRAVRAPVPLALSAAALTLLTVCGCRSLEPLRPIEPRAGEPVTLQVAKGLAYVPAALLLGAVVVTYEIAADLAEDRAHQVAIDEELGRPEREIDRQIY